MWKRATLSIVFLELFCVLALNAPAFGAGAADTRILTIVAQIWVDRDSEHRAYLAEQLSTITQGMAVKSDISDVSIDRIASLLGHHDPAVRDGAAIALSFVGARAKRALPDLRRAFYEVEADQNDPVWRNSLSYQSSICVSMFRIGGAQGVPDRCQIFLHKASPTAFSLRRSATIFVRDDQIPIFVETLKTFADARTLDASTNTFEGAERHLTDIKIRIDAASYIRASNLNHADRAELVAFSSSDQDSSWQPAWSHLVGILSSEFGNSNVVQHGSGQP